MAEPFSQATSIPRVFLLHLTGHDRHADGNGKRTPPPGACVPGPGLGPICGRDTPKPGSSGIGGPPRSSDRQRSQSPLRPPSPRMGSEARLRCAEMVGTEFARPCVLGGSRRSGPDWLMGPPGETIRRAIPRPAHGPSYARRAFLSSPKVTIFGGEATLEASQGSSLTVSRPVGGILIGGRVEFCGAMSNVVTWSFVRTATDAAAESVQKVVLKVVPQARGGVRDSVLFTSSLTAPASTEPTLRR